MRESARGPSKLGCRPVLARVDLEYRTICPGQSPTPWLVPLPARDIELDFCCFRKFDKVVCMSGLLIAFVNLIVDNLEHGNRRYLLLVW